ncbi:MAG: type II toxin-antitoxin system RelE/ParE family toxin [Nitrospirae bacterium]|nr:type II toxin-antitoxin system RelE/ParE family toxin [Nitrospirota bacterium]
MRKIERQFIPEILDKIEALITNPFPIKSKKLKGSEMCFRIRIGQYRVIYKVDSKDKIITIYHIRHRKDFYKKMN